MKKTVDLLCKYTQEKMTLPTMRTALTIDDDYSLAVFIVCAYNCYVTTHSKECYSLITNIDALKISEKEIQVFLQDVKTYIMDTVKTKEYTMARKNELRKEAEDETGRDTSVTGKNI